MKIKRKSVDRTYLKRVVDREFVYLGVNDDNFSGYISLFKINQSTSSCIIKYNEKNVCVIDTGYSLLQYIPLGENYTATAFFDENNRIIQWYFDITYKNGIGEDGIPYYDDLFLDVVILPPLEIHLLDKDELDEALHNKEISEEQYKLACNVADKLMKDISTNKITFMKRHETDLQHMISLIK